MLTKDLDFLRGLLSEFKGEMKYKPKDLRDVTATIPVRIVSANHWITELEKLIAAKDAEYQALAEAHESRKAAQLLTHGVTVTTTDGTALTLDAGETSRLYWNLLNVIEGPPRLIESLVADAVKGGATLEEPQQ